MAFFKAPILFVAFCLIMILPESSQAQCSASMGQVHGCRSGIACNHPNKRTGAPLWVCQDPPPRGSSSSSTSSSSSVSSSASGSSSSSSSAPSKRATTKKSTGSSQAASKPDCGSGFVPDASGTGCISLEKQCENDPQCSKGNANTEEAPTPGTDMEPISRSSSGPCDFGYNLIYASDNSFYLEELGDTRAASAKQGGIQFCRKTSVTSEQVAEAMERKKGQGVSASCRDRSGTEYIENGNRFCRYMANGGADEYSGPVVCQINASGEMHTCNPENGSKTADGGECETMFNQVKQACFIQAEKASTDCSQENDGIQAAMDASKAVGAGSTVSMQMACSKLGEISKIANVSLTGWQSFCAFTQSNCETECTRAKSLYEQQGCISEASKPSYAAEYRTVRENVAVCISYKKRIAEAAQHATAALMQLQAAKKCEQDTGNGLTTANLDECKKNPNNPLCTDAQKCSNPTFAASNAVCKCLNNPNTKECVAATGAAGSRGVAGGGMTIPGSGGSNTDPAAAFIPPSASAENPFATDLKNGAKTNELNLGGAKGNAGLGGNSGGAGGGMGANSYGGGGGAPGTEGDKSKINSGFYGGANGAAGGYFGRTTGAGGAGARASAGGVNYNKMAGGAQFDPRRYIAGMNGKGGEYINGPNLDIFKIVKNRIEAKKPTMLDPDFKK